MIIYKLSLTLLLVFTPILFWAQQTHWVTTVGGGGGESCSHLALTSGGVVVGGIFQQGFTVEGQSFNLVGGFDIFILRYDATGNFQQGFVLGNIGNNELKALQTDSLGNIYVCGNFSGTLNLGTATLFSHTISHFIAKYTSNGQLVWAERILGKGVNVIEDMQWDYQQEHLLISGNFNDSLSIQQASLYHDLGINFFIVKIAQNGTLKWMKKAPSAKSATVRSILGHSDGSIWAAVEFRDQLIMPQDTHFHNYVFTDIMLIQLDSQGNWLQWKRWGGVYEDRPSKLVADPDGQHFWLVGNFAGVLHTDTITLLTAYRYFDAFWVKLNNAGRAVAANKTYTDANTFVQTAAFYQGQLRLGGYFLDSLQAVQKHISKGGYDMFELAVDTANAALLASETTGGAGNDLLNALLYSPQGLYLAGSFQQVMRYQDQQLAASGFSDGWLAQKATLTPANDLPDIPKFIVVQLRPNPGKSTVTIEVDEPIELQWQLYALNGQQLAQGSSQNINIKNLPKGIYSVQVRTQAGQGVAKLVKK